MKMSYYNIRKKEIEKTKITNDIIEESSINEGSADSNDNAKKANSNDKSKNNLTKKELNDSKKDSSKVFKKRGSSIMSKIFLQDTTVNSNTNNDSIKAVNDLKNLILIPIKEIVIKIYCKKMKKKIQLNSIFLQVQALEKKSLIKITGIKNLEGVKQGKKQS